MAIHALRNQSADMSLDVICSFNMGNERFNGVRSIKKDVYFPLGCMWYTATSIKRYGDDILAGPTRTKQQV